LETILNSVAKWFGRRWSAELINITGDRNPEIHGDAKWRSRGQGGVGKML
jgi:hypothetical protein